MRKSQPSQTDAVLCAHCVLVQVPPSAPLEPNITPRNAARVSTFKTWGGRERADRQHSKDATTRTSAARALRSRREPFWKLRAEPPTLRAEPPCKTAIFVCDGVRWTLPTDADPVVPCINRKRQNLTESFSGDKSSLARTPTSRAWLCETSAASEDRSSPMVSIASPGVTAPLPVSAIKSRVSGAVHERRSTA